MTWYKIHLIYNQMPTLHHNVQMRTEFSSLWIANKCARGLNLFELKEQPVDGEILYSPEPVEPRLKAFLEKYKGIPCEKPDGSTVTPVIHGTQDWNYWFGGAMREFEELQDQES